MTRTVLPLLLCLAAFLPACATAPDGPEQKLPIYDSFAGAPVRYEVIKRLWTESGRSLFRVPTYATQEEAMADFRSQAASLGGNGIINFGCGRLPGVSGEGKRLACNGTVVRFL